MIITEIVEERPDLVRRYSDVGFLIRQDQTGDEYSEAVDLITSPFTYTETDIPIDTEEISDSEALAIITGGEYHEPDESEQPA